MSLRKIFAAMLAAALAVSLVLPAGEAAAASAGTSKETVQQVVSLLGIMTGDATGSMNLNKNVTRAEFAKMLISASSYKDKGSAVSNVSPFKDVSYSYWAAGYIKTAVQNGWFSGYIDGTFRPSNPIKLEEAVSATLKLLGYTTSDFTGSYPYAQLAKYEALGLDKNITAQKGQYLTRQDCMYLLYNALNAVTKTGSVYASTLGYTVNSDGEIDYSALIGSTLEGPIIVIDDSWSDGLPFDSSSAVVYRNGFDSSFDAIGAYDVVYYSEGLRRIWVYSNRVTGVYESASPNTVSPSSVTISGNSYSLTSQTAKYALSTLGSYRIGDRITLLTGMDGGIVGVVSANSTSSVLYGIVTDITSKTYKDAGGNTYTSQSVSIVDTDTVSHTYAVSTVSVSEGDAVQVYVSNASTVIVKLTAKTLSGNVNSTGTAAAGYSFADDISILDVSDAGMQSVYPARLAGIALSSTNVLYYALNGSNEITHLILDDVTHDLYKYGIITDATVNNTGMSASSSFACIFDGTESTLSSSAKAFSALEGPCAAVLNGNALLSMTNLTGSKLTAISGELAITDGNSYRISDSVAVYEYKDSAYYLTSLSLVSNLNEYTLTGYFEKRSDNGSRIRVIIAEAK